MFLPRKNTVSDIVTASVVWLALGVSLGWYYTFTYYGRSGWPMPMPEPCAALILYYFSVLNADPWRQAIHWLAVFPIAGMVWVSTLTITAPFFGGTRKEYPWTLLRFSTTCVPLILPLPVMTYLAGGSLYGFSWRHILEVALRQAAVMPSAWVTPVYVGLAVAALIWQLFTYVKVFDLHGKKAVLHYLVSAILVVLLCCGAATLASFPLRWWLE